MNTDKLTNLLWVFLCLSIFFSIWFKLLNRKTTFKSFIPEISLILIWIYYDYLYIIFIALIKYICYVLVILAHIAIFKYNSKSYVWWLIFAIFWSWYLGFIPLR